MVQQTPVWALLALPMAILFLVATALFVYGVSQPRYRGATLGILAVGAMLVLGGGFFVGTVHTVRQVETTETRMQTLSGGSMTESSISVAPEMVAVTTGSSEPAAPPSPAPADVAGRIEQFDGSQRSGTRIDKLPEWVTSPEKSDEWTVTLDSGSRASFEECERELLAEASTRLAAHLAAIHPEAARWHPDRDAIRNSRAVLHRVRETQVVRIDVANSVIREPLCREYWQLSLTPEVTEHLVSIYRPAISRERATWLAGGVGIATLLFGAAAVGLRMGSGRPRPVTA